MQAPLFLRELTDKEREALEAGRRSSQGFTVRRSQMLLASAQGQTTTTIARQVGCNDQTVRNAIHDFHQRGVAALEPKSSRPHTTYEAFDAPGRERLRALLHQTPRTFGKDTSIWTLDLAAEVSVTVGIVSRPISGETVRNALAQLGVRWKRAKHWITSPDPDYIRKKKRRDALIRLVATHPTWALGFQDEVWWSRLAQPDQHRWVDQDSGTHLQELQPSKQDPDPKALACYGLLLRSPEQTDQMLLRFVDGRPVSAVTTDFLTVCCEHLTAQAITVLVLIWDNASWHKSQMVRTWLRNHNQKVKQTGEGLRILSCFLPSKSPWLNPIEPKWVHGKRNISETDRILSANELEARVCAYYGCSQQPHLLMPKKVA
jgi:predicted ArsR family transcriptional regulator